MATITGIVTLDETDILEVDADPSAGAGTPAAIGSLAVVKGSLGIWQKTTATVTDWYKVDTKILFQSYPLATTSGPTTSATTSGTAATISEMTTTFTPSQSTNNIQAWFSGSFSFTKAATANIAIFVDGTLQAETQRSSIFVANEIKVLSTQWQSQLSVASHTVDVRYWVSGQTVTAVGTQRGFTIEETKT